MQFKFLKSIILNRDNFNEALAGGITVDYFPDANSKGLFTVLLNYNGSYNDTLTYDKLNTYIFDYPTVMKQNIQTAFMSAINSEDELNFQFLVDGLRKQYKSRILDDTLHNTAKFYRDGDVDKSIELMESGLRKIELLGAGDYTARDIKDTVDLSIKSYDERKEGKLRKAIYTGFSVIDRATRGLFEGEVFVLLGPSKAGKTFIATNIGYNAYQQGNNILHISAEMCEEEMRYRLEACMTKLPIDLIESSKLSPDQEKIYKETLLAQKQRTNAYKIVDAPACSIGTIIAETEKMKKINKVDLVIVDYLGLITTTYKTNSDWERISYVINSLKSHVARKNKVAVLVIVQLTTAAAKRKRWFEQEDAAGSADVYRSADVIIGVRNKNIGDEDNKFRPITEIEGKILGSRKGKKESFNLEGSFSFGHVREAVGRR